MTTAPPTLPGIHKRNSMPPRPFDAAVLAIFESIALCLCRDFRSIHFNVSHWVCHLDHHTTDSLSPTSRLLPFPIKEYDMILSAECKDSRKCYFIRLDQHLPIHPHETLYVFIGSSINIPSHPLHFEVLSKTGHSLIFPKLPLRMQYSLCMPHTDQLY